MRSLRNTQRPYLPSFNRPIDIVYWAGAPVSGLILGLDLLRWPADFFVLGVIGVGASLLGRRIEGSVADHRVTGWLWVAIFLLVWLPIAFVRHSFPFGR